MMKVQKFKNGVRETSIVTVMDLLPTENFTMFVCLSYPNSQHDVTRVSPAVV